MQAVPEKAAGLARKSKSKGHRNALSQAVDTLDPADLYGFASVPLNSAELSLLAFSPASRPGRSDGPRTMRCLNEPSSSRSLLRRNLDEVFHGGSRGGSQQKLAMRRSRDRGRWKDRPLAEQLEAIRLDVTRLMEEAYQCLRELLLPALEEAGIILMQYSSLSRTERTRSRNLLRSRPFSPS